MTNLTKLLIGLTVASILTGCGAAPPRGATTEREIVERYLDAVQRRDVAALRQLLPATHRADAELEAAANSTEGAPVEAGIVTLRFSTGFPRRYSSATITGRYMHQGTAVPYERHLELEEIDARWYLIMGRAQP